MRKYSTDPRYQRFIHSVQWQHARRAALERDKFLCQDCLKVGRVMPAREVHHVRPLQGIADNGEFQRMASSLDNLVSLCTDCHEARHAILDSHNPKVKRAREKKQIEHFIEEYL